MLLALIVLVAWAFLYTWSNRVTTYAPDETLYVSIANWLPHHLPGGLFNFDFYQRGTQRLEIFILAVTLKLFGSPGGFSGAHVLNTLAFASSAVAVYLIARGMGVRAWLALVGAVLTVAVPWNVLAMGWLTEPVAYPAFAWALWATWRAVDDPRPGTQLRAILFVFTAMLCRSIFLVLLALLPICVVLQELRFGSLRPRSFDPRAFLRRHVVVVGLVAVGILALLLSVVGVLPPTAKLTGQYGTKITVDISQLLKQDSFWGSRGVVGIGLIPWAVGFGWILSRLVLPRDPRAHGLALVLLFAVVLVAYGSKPVPEIPFYVDERYMMYLAPVLVVAFVVALERRDAWFPAVVAAGVFGGWLVWRAHWDPTGAPTQYFVAPAEEFYARVALLKTATRTPDWISQRDLFWVLMSAASVVAAYAATRWRGARVISVLTVAVLVPLQLGQGQYAVKKYVNGAGGRYQATLDQRAWVDKAVHSKEGSVGVFTAGVGNLGYYDFIWHGLQFWNPSITYAYGWRTPPVPALLGDTNRILDVDENTGRIKAGGPLPPYLVLPRDFVQAEPAGEPIVRPAFAGLDLWRVDKPDRAVFTVTSVEADGAVEPLTNIRFYAVAQPAGKRCATIPIKGTSAATGPTPRVPYRVGPKRGVLEPGQQIGLELPLEFGGKPYIDMPVRAKGKIQAVDGRTNAARLLIITTGPCTTA